MHFKINMVSKSLSFLKKYWLDLVLVFIILCLSPLFLYKLGQTSLVSWDEGWYAAIANNILKSGDFLRLTFNGRPFFDHPVAGFWWMAMSFKLLGVSNFSARFPSAVFGILTLIFVYFLGKELFNKWVGFASAIALVSAPWFIYRSRSGDLDIFLTFFFILSIWMAVKSLDQKKFFPFLGVSLGLLFLTKTLVAFAILPALIVIYVGRKIDRSSVSKGLISFGIIVGIWFISLLTLGTGFISQYFSVGLPGVSVKTSYLDNLKLVRDYIHAGIGKWFWPGAGSVFATLLTGKRSFYILAFDSSLSFYDSFFFRFRLFY
jgi:dolichyl-phosphate-mannose--protein O-mannosyl transferase